MASALGFSPRTQFTRVGTPLARPRRCGCNGPTEPSEPAGPKCTAGEDPVYNLGQLHP